MCITEGWKYANEWPKCMVWKYNICNFRYTVPFIGDVTFSEGLSVGRAHWPFFECPQQYTSPVSGSIREKSKMHVELY